MYENVYKRMQFMVSIWFVFFIYFIYWPPFLDYYVSLYVRHIHILLYIFQRSTDNFYTKLLSSLESKKYDLYL